MTPAYPGADEAVALALDVGGTKVLGGLVTASGEIRTTRRASTAPTAGGGVDPGFRATLDVLTALSAERGHGTVVAVGAGFPEYVRDGELRSTEVLAWQEQPGPLLAAHLPGVPVVVESDVRCGAVAEARLGAGAGYPSVLYLSWGTGISSTLVLDGVPLPGHRGEAIAAGELEVPPLVDPTWTGNLEQYASGAAITARYLATAGHPAAPPAEPPDTRRAHRPCADGGGDPSPETDREAVPRPETDREAVPRPETDREAVPRPEADREAARRRDPLPGRSQPPRTTADQPPGATSPTNHGNQPPGATRDAASRTDQLPGTTSPADHSSHQTQATDHQPSATTHRQPQAGADRTSGNTPGAATPTDQSSHQTQATDHQPSATTHRQPQAGADHSPGNTPGATSRGSRPSGDAPAVVSATGRDIRLPGGARDVAALADRGDDAAATVLRTAGAAVGITLARLVAVLDPAAVVLGGGLGCADTLATRTALETYRSTVARRPSPPPLVPAALGPTAGLIGAALLAHAARDH